MPADYSKWDTANVSNSENETVPDPGSSGTLKGAGLDVNVSTIEELMQSLCDNRSWWKSLKPDERYEWFVGCYPMRVDDDYEWDGGNVH